MPKIDIVLTADGQIGFYVQNGDFAEGQATIEQLAAFLGQRLPLADLSPIEQHRPNAEQIEQLQQHYHHEQEEPGHAH